MSIHIHMPAVKFQRGSLRIEVADREGEEKGEDNREGEAKKDGGRGGEKGGSEGD